MSQYAASLPSDGTVPKDIASFFSDFYKISDTEAAHEDYADALTSDGVLTMGSKRVTGRAGQSLSSPYILALRKAMWEKVSSRSHYPLKIFSFAPLSEEGGEVMLYGTVDYGLRDGKKAEGIEWAARAKLVRVEVRLRMSEYQVYLDPGAMAAKAK
ncbi:hypothetical protein B0A48_16695 [Cryoendolithus antarcticus]|uniref:SnoaL-like domain-containing protein n=1 Tax=Cryoendolithus antarcticus TaxID=1507870 RepID=A0A1V8SFC8_9PEZI|nr:hypothetical protein B0A48_16695 [Cryoendolithus antarcticus]